MNTKLFKTVILIFATILFTLPLSGGRAVDALDGATDILNTMSAGTLASHSIHFGLPVSSAPIESDDYIMIDLPHFTGISEPTYLTGGFTGTPVYSIILTRIRITGISMSPGASLSINGVTAFNPTSWQYFNLSISVCDDADGLIVKNVANIWATTFDGSVSISAEIETESGYLRINGIAAPGMFVNFIENGTSIGTTVAAPSGVFTQIFPGISPYPHAIQIFGVDTDNRTTAPTEIDVMPIVSAITTVSGIVLSPTLELDKEEIERGEEITVDGQGPPNYTIKIFSEPPLNSYETTTSDEGVYSYTISDTADLSYGDHDVYSIAQDGLGGQSLTSMNDVFRITGGSSGGGGTPSCDISKGDLNCDSNVNLIDFSILLYYWGTTDGLADINGDGRVNLVDFSILLFYWGT